MARAKIRFVPYDNDEFGLISFHSHDSAQDIAALIINESVHGACIAINRKLIQAKMPLAIGLLAVIKIGKLDKEQVVVRWIKEVDDDIIKLGIEYQKRVSEA
jgi:hypothetical protein